MKKLVLLGVSALALVACTTSEAPVVEVARVEPVAQAAPVAVVTPRAPAALLAKVPEAYRDIFAPLEVSPALMDELRNASGERVFEELAAISAVRVPGAADRLAAMYARETSPALKQRIVAAMPLRGANATPAARQLVADVASGDPDIAQALAAAERLDEAATTDIVALLRKRAQAAASAGDAAGARKVRDAIDHYEFQDVTLPKFAYRAPPKFVVTPASAKSIRVLAFGDFGTGSSEQIATAKAMQAFNRKTPFTFGITLGDNFYGTGLDTPDNPRWKTQWEDLYSPMGVKFYPTFGNHDVNGDSPAAEIAYSKLSKSWNFPAPYYTYMAGSVQFFAIDTQRITDDELDWLEKELKASTATWKIVYGHHQIYSATRGDSGLVDRLLPLLERNKVDMYLCGHDHNLQELAPEQGVHFFVMGAGGASLYDFDALERGNYPRSLFRSKEHGFGVIEATKGMLTVSLVGLDGKTLHKRELVR